MYVFMYNSSVLLYKYIQIFHLRNIKIHNNMKLVYIF